MDEQGYTPKMFNRVSREGYLVSDGYIVVAVAGDIS